jgi:hypothetical protein
MNPHSTLLLSLSLYVSHGNIRVTLLLFLSSRVQSRLRMNTAGRPVNPPVIPLTSHSASLSNEKLIQYCALIFSLLSPLFFFSKQRRKVCRLVNNQLLIKNICIECALKNWRKKETKKTFIGNSISSLFPAIEWNLFPVKETRSELKVLERSRKC